MKKFIPYIIAAVIIVGGAIFILTSGSDNAQKDGAKPESTDQTGIQEGESAIVAVDACDVLTESAAKQILGDTAEKGDTSAGSVATDDISVSNCVYSTKIDPSTIGINNSKGVSVLARAAKTQTGVTSNKAVFGELKPMDVQDVPGIGDTAFYNPEYGQLNVLKGGNYYIVSNYTGTSTNSTIEQATELAKLLEFK